LMPRRVASDIIPEMMMRERRVATTRPGGCFGIYGSDPDKEEDADAHFPPD
jgi:hypothetical protein